MTRTVIVGAVRTAIGDYGKSLSEIPAYVLGQKVIAEALARARIEAKAVDEVIMGCVLQAGQGMNPARRAALAAGLAVETPAYTINKVCGSGLKAVALGVQTIMVGDAQVVVAGGMESMSQAPYYVPKARFGYRMGHAELIDGMIYDGLTCPFNNYHMGITAENLADKYSISRREQDEFALESHRRAAEAQQHGLFDEEIVPVIVDQCKKSGEVLIFKSDEHVRPDTSLERLSQLKPVFKPNGTITAGNASSLSDGAAAVVIVSEEKARSEGLAPLAEIVAYASVGVDPAYMGLGPVGAIKRVLEKAKLSMGDVGLFEVNEAFAAQVLAVARELKLDLSKTNVNGGAIALGHPIGASGARILVTLLYEMRRRQVEFGVAALCIGGGQGIAILVRQR